MATLRHDRRRSRRHPSMEDVRSRIEIERAVEQEARPAHHTERRDVVYVRVCDDAIYGAHLHARLHGRVSGLARVSAALAVRAYGPVEFHLRASVDDGEPRPTARDEISRVLFPPIPPADPVRLPMSAITRDSLLDLS